MGRCTAAKKDGQTCGRWALSGLTTCLYHTPHEQRVFTPPDELVILQRELKAVQRGSRGLKGAKRTAMLLALTSKIVELKQMRAKEQMRKPWQPPQV